MSSNWIFEFKEERERHCLYRRPIPREEEEEEEEEEKTTLTTR